MVFIRPSPDIILIKEIPAKALTIMYQAINLGNVLVSLVIGRVIWQELAFSRLLSLLYSLVLFLVMSRDLQLAGGS